jgi:hypothetical protein
MNEIITIKDEPFRKGFAIKMSNAQTASEYFSYYLENVITNVGKVVEFPKEDPRTLVYVAEARDSKDRLENFKGLFFDNKMDAEDLIELVNVYQDYDEKLCGPFKEGCRFNFEIVETEAQVDKYTDLKEDFLDKNNHMDLNIDQDLTKALIDKEMKVEG